jgi:hypothetical protein
MQEQLTLTFQQYESLVYLAREGARLKGFLDAAKKDPRLEQLVVRARNYVGNDANGARNLESFLKTIEAANGITRYFLAVRWQELDAPLPPRTAGAPTRFPENWPPQLQGSLELLTRPIAKADVVAYLQTHAKNPTSVLVTLDPGLVVGWTPLDSFFIQ